MIKRMDLGWVTVKDFKKSKEFFTKTLGLKVHEENEQWGWLELQGSEGGAYLGVGQEHPEFSSTEKAGQNAVMTMSVDNIHEARKTLAAKGVTFVGEIMELPTVKMLMFVDPDGNKFQLVELAPDHK